MKQALLITSYKDFEQLIDLIKQFDYNFNIYLHIDKKSELNKDIYKELLSISNVKYISRKYRINWGGINHLKAIILLSKKALINKDNKYFHLITGQDFPIKPNDYFKNLLFNNCNKNINYLDISKLPKSGWAKENGGMDRIEYYCLYDLFNAKTSFGNKWILRIINIQRKLNIKRSINFSKQLYGGSTYWTLYYDTLQYVIDFTKKNPIFLNRFRFTFCAEEIYFQTIIMNSEFANHVFNDNLRYIDWETGRGGFPAFLDENDYEILINSDKLFARKIETKRNNLKQMLTLYLNINDCSNTK